MASDARLARWVAMLPPDEYFYSKDSYIEGVTSRLAKQLVREGFSPTDAIWAANVQGFARSWDRGILLADLCRYADRIHGGGGWQAIEDYGSYAPGAPHQSLDEARRTAMDRLCFLARQPKPGQMQRGKAGGQS